ncbi:MAG: hypothetical protein ACW98K_07445 [Candidatus Kariarchaeaceae archaeon]|jgi:hypothetical protein
MSSQTGQEQTLREIYTHKTQLPNKKTTFLFWFLSVFAATFLLAGNLYGALLFIGWGILSAYVWRRVGWAITYRMYILPMKKMQEHQISQEVPSRLLRSIFGSNIRRSFLQFETADIDISSLKRIFRMSIRVFISFIALAATIARILVPIIKGSFEDADSFDADETLEKIVGPAVLLGFIFAFPLLSIYLPQAFITQDARVMVIHEDGAIKYAGSKIRDTFDGFFGITGMISGYDIFKNELGISLTNSIVVFSFIVIFGVIIASPALFPAIMIYYRKHSEYVNRFREEATKAKIYPARTTINPLSTDEIQALVLGDVRPVHEVVPATLIGKMKQLVAGPKFEYPKLSEEEIRGIELKGAWVCRT